MKEGRYLTDDRGEIVFDTDKGRKHIVLPKYNLPKIKNAAGYFNYPNADLIDVFIGSEGTLGVISESSIMLLPSFKSIFSGIVFFENHNDIFDFVKKVKENHPRYGNSQNLSKTAAGAMSLEYFDKNTLDFIKDSYPSIPDTAQGAVLFEQDVYEEDDESALMDEWFALISQSGVKEESVWFAQILQKLKNLGFLDIGFLKGNEIVHRQDT